MQYISKYISPLGEILLASDEEGLIGLWFTNQKFYANNLESEVKEEETNIIKETKKWLDIYFRGEEPKFKIPLHLKGSEFQELVWNILLSIPYGNTRTYKELAKIIIEKKNIKRMSSQAVGGAVGHNPISIIIPCHRVVGSNGKLTGYAGGLDKKEYLLNIEKGKKIIR